MERLIPDTNSRPVLNYRFATDEEQELLSLAVDEDDRCQFIKDPKIVIELGCGFKFIQVLRFFYANTQ